MFSAWRNIPFTYRSKVAVMPPPLEESGMDARTLMKLIGCPVSLVHRTDWPVLVNWT